MNGKTRSAVFVFAALLGLIPLAGCVTPASGGSTHTRVSRTTDVDGDRVRVKISHGWSSLELKMRGEIKLNDDDSEVVSISRDGYFVLTRREGLKVRKVRIEPGPGGRLEYSGNAADTEEQGRVWIAALLPDLVEESGLWAEERARRLFKAEGVEGVLMAIERIDHDSTKAVYFGVLLGEADLSPDDFEHMQREVGKEVESDYHAAAILESMLDHRVGRNVTGEALFKAIDSIESAYHRAQLLKPLADRASELDLPAYLDAVDGIESDYHRQEVIGRLLDQQDLDEPSMVKVLHQVRRVDSDYHAAQLLQRMTDRIPARPEARSAYFAAVRDIESDYHRQELLASILSHNALADREILKSVIDIAADIESDYHKAQLLSSIPQEARDEVSDDLLLEVIDAATTIGSDHHLAQVLDSILQQDTLSQPVLRGLLDAVKQHLGNNHQRGQLLDRITDRLTI